MQPSLPDITSLSKEVQPYDVLIVGAGPVGMTLALTLRRAGIRVLLVDREEKTGTTTRAAIVWPRTLEELDLLGIVDGWQRDGVPLEEMHFHLNTAQPIIVPVAQNESPHAHPRGIGQDRTEALLDSAIRSSGADYFRGVEVVSLNLQLEGEGVAATLRSSDGQETKITATWLVGCDGSKSIVRESAGIQRSGRRNAGMQVIQGDFRLQTSFALAPGHAYFWRGSEGSLLLMIPESIDEHYRILVVLPDDGSHETPTLEDIQERAQAFIPDLQLYDTRWRNRFRTQQLNAEKYRVGHAFIAGDAAHVWVPIGGQGMNVGIQDAFNLGWKLAEVIKGRLSDAILDTYEAERRPIAQDEVTLTSRMYDLLTAQTPVHEVIRSLIPLVFGLSPIAGRIAASFSELGIRYSPNLLVEKDPGGAGPTTGMRAPDASLIHLPQGESLRLFDLFRPGHWIALAWVFAANDVQNVLEPLHLLNKSLGAEVFVIDASKSGLQLESPDQHIEYLRDPAQLACTAYHVYHSSLHLIRPDGVIAFRSKLPASSLRHFIDILLKSH